MLTNFLKNKTLLIFSVLLLIYLSPIVIFGENSYINNHDNLDSEVPYRVVLAESGKVFTLDAKAPVYQIMNGIPRASLPSGFNFVMWLFLILKPFMAYMVNYIIIHLIAFIGMYLLIKRHILEEKDELISAGVALCFAFLPFYSIYGLSVAGQPLLLYAFLNIKKNITRAIDLLLVMLFPLYSSLGHVGVFIILTMAALFVHDSIKNKKINRSLLLCLFVFVALSFLSEINLFQQTFFDRNYASQRSAWMGKGINIGEAAKRAADIFVSGDTTSESLQNSYILPLAVIIILLCLFSRSDCVLLSRLLFTAFIFAVWCGLFRWDGIFFLKQKVEILRTFQWDRFFWMYPTIWGVIFAVSLSKIPRFKYSKYLIAIIIILQANYAFVNNDVQSQISGSAAAMKGRSTKLLTYKRFYSAKLFKAVASRIAIPQKDYRVVSVGLHPAVAQYNGFYTLDGYQNTYPLEYRTKFREVIAKELAKSKRWKDYFDRWGDRCYIFSSEIDNMYVRKERKLKIQNLQLNSKALRNLGCNYVLSAVEIMNFRQNGLSFIKKFEDEYSPWEIFLYKVK